MSLLQNQLKFVREGGTNVSIENLPLTSWLGDYKGPYNLYEGSLTFFNCATRVLYADFLLKMEIQKELVSNYLKKFLLLENYLFFLV